MKIKYLLFGLCLASVVIFVSCGDSGVPENLSLEEKLNNAVSGYVEKWNYKPAISVSVFSKDEQIDFSYAGGLASVSHGIKNELETPHFIYSITKSFVAASIVQLEKEGKLSLSDSLDKYVQDTNRIYINPDATIRELLSHRSGINDYTESSSIIYSNPFSKTDEWNPQTILSFIETPALDRGDFVYSSANYILLGMIIEHVSGIKANEYLNTNFFEPLNLSARLYPEDSLELSDLSHPHCYPNTFLNLAGDGETPIDITDVISNALDLLGKCGWTAGGVATDAENVATWGYALLSENGKVSSSIRNEILDSVSSFTDKSLESVAYGYGIRKLFHGDFEFVGSYGRSVGDENLMFYNKDKDVCIAILSSSNMRKDKTPNIDELMYEIFECL